MADTSKVYVNTTDGYWYYYNGSAWVQGGVYQSTGVAANSIYLDNLNNHVIGNDFEYNVENASERPYIVFDLLKNFDMGNLQSLGAKLKITNLGDAFGAGKYAIKFNKTGFGQVFEFNSDFPGDLIVNKETELNLSKNHSSAYSGVIPTQISFGMNLNVYSDKDFNFIIKDLELYINGDKLKYGIDYVLSNNSNQSDITEEVNFLAKRKYVDDIKNTLQSEITDLRN
jgi:hypothetical protein